MPFYKKLIVQEEDVPGAIRKFLRDLLEKGGMEAILVPSRLPYKGMVMPTLIRESSQMDHADPLAPVVPLNSARLAAQLTRDGTGRSIGAVMRPCEMRAFIELVKLNQGRTEGLTMIGVDCLGRYETNDFRHLDGTIPSFTRSFYKDFREGRAPARDGKDLAQACQACEHPIPQGADIRIQLIGADWKEDLILEGATPGGEEILSRLELPDGSPPPQAREAARALLEQREAFRNRWLGEIREQTRDAEGLLNLLGNCINCYNCRVACPVCYCRECVFVTETFQHDSEQYFQWAEKRGRLKMPTDTLFYHLTRMQHMSTLCLGCGQCTSACPQEIPVAQLFQSVAGETQKAFDYHPGRDLKEPMPMAVFYEKELEHVARNK